MRRSASQKYVSSFIVAERPLDFQFGWLLSFWNLAGVPFTYSYSIIFMATHDPAMYKFPLWGNILLYTTLLTAYYVCVFAIDKSGCSVSELICTIVYSDSILPCRKSHASRCSRTVIPVSARPSLNSRAALSRTRRLCRLPMATSS